jgi:hypothetical protein
VRIRVAADDVGNRIYTFGGEGNLKLPPTEMYQVENCEWEVLAHMKIPRHGIKAVAVGGNMFIPGCEILLKLRRGIAQILKLGRPRYSVYAKHVHFQKKISTGRTGIKCASIIWRLGSRQFYVGSGLDVM